MAMAMTGITDSKETKQNPENQNKTINPSHNTIPADFCYIAYAYLATGRKLKLKFT